MSSSYEDYQRRVLEDVGYFQCQMDEKLRECMPATHSDGYPFSPVGYRGSNLNADL